MVACPTCNRSRVARGRKIFIVENGPDMKTFEDIKAAQAYRAEHGGQVFQKILKEI